MKDFGKALGSHGGVFDRFDGCLFALGSCVALTAIGALDFAAA